MYIRSLFVLFCFLVSPASGAQVVIHKAVSGVRGNYLWWEERVQGGKLNVYRGTDEASLELLPQSALEPVCKTCTNAMVIDTSAVRGQPYIYRVEHFFQNDLVVRGLPDKTLLVRDFRTEEHEASPAGSSDLFSSNMVGPNPARWYGQIFAHKLSYERYLDTVVPGRRYSVRLWFGSISTGPSVKGALRVSLSPRRPIADIVVPVGQLVTYENRAVEFEVPGGPAGWNQFHVSVSGDVSLMLERIEVFEKI